MVEVRGRSIGNGGGRKKRRSSGGGVRSGSRCVIYPCLAFALVLGLSTFLRQRWFGAPRETPSVRGGSDMEDVGEGASASASTSESASASAPVVAFAISVTSLDLPQGSAMLDSAEVLINSILAACMFSRYRFETLAFALPSVSQEGRQHLKDMGWRVIEKDLPVAVEDIENETYRNHVVKSGCCGANEFIKLHAYTLTEYHRVVHLDADTLMLHPMDELMESEESLLYTTDPAMATVVSKVLPVQGGFLLVRPDIGVYDELRAIVREGDWKLGVGWRNSKIGYFYGGATIQGLLAYYYHAVAVGKAREVDRCIYNHMSDSDVCRSSRYTVNATATQAAAAAPMPQRHTDQGVVQRKDGTEAGAMAAASVVSSIKSVHFTQSCRKPWLCGQLAIKPAQGGSCPLLQQAWRDGRERVLASRGLPPTEACVRGAYSPIPRS